MLYYNSKITFHQYASKFYVGSATNGVEYLGVITSGTDDYLLSASSSRLYFSKKVNETRTQLWECATKSDFYKNNLDEAVLTLDGDLLLVINSTSIELRRLAEGNTIWKTTFKN